MGSVEVAGYVQGGVTFFQVVSGVATPFLLAYVAYITNRKNQLQAQLNDKKRANYEIFLELLIEAIKNSEQKKDTTFEHLRDKMLAFKKDLILFASPKTVLLFNRWIKHSAENKEQEMFRDMGELVMSLREELGLSNKGLGVYDLIQVLIKDDIKQTLLAKK